MKTDFDIIIIGGGINGAGIARDASGKGYSVALLEMNDLASATSSWSTKLIHGGLRYMEQYQFRLVREALIEREKLMEIAPHIIRPLRFILPHSPNLRPSWLIKLGLLIYDNIIRRNYLPSSKSVNFNSLNENPLKENYKKGFEYSDCMVEDARLVILNAMDAKINNATIMTNTEVIKLENDGVKWLVEAKNKINGASKKIKLSSKVLVNASGPWTDKLISVINKNRHNQKNTKLIKGSHIVVPKIYSHDKAYIFQHFDGRIIFTIPFEKDFSLIGTTDIAYNGNPSKAKISNDEIDYLCKAVSSYFRKEINSSHIIWNYSGVRSLFDDGSLNAKDITRDYKIETDYLNRLMYLSIFGGKITTYRKLAEEVTKIIDNQFGKKSKNWTSNKPLPGGEFSPSQFNSLLKKNIKKYSFIDQKIIERLFKSYGTNLQNILKKKTSIKELGIYFGAGLYQCEVEWLINNEWAKTASDIAWRRTKLGIVLSTNEIKSLDQYIASRK